MRKKKATRAPQQSSPRGRRHTLRRRLARCTEAAGELAEAGGRSSCGGDAASGIAGGGRRPELDLGRARGEAGDLVGVGIERAAWAWVGVG